MVELSEKVKFGVTHTGSFLSFAEEPHLYLEIHSQVGNSENFRFQDVPQLADTIRSKARDYINKNLVSPYKHAFRLAWPRSWWPEGTRHFYRSETHDSTKGGNRGPKNDRKHKKSSFGHDNGQRDSSNASNSSAPEMHPAGKHHSNMAPIGSKEGHSPEFDHNERQYQELKTPLRDSVYEEEEEDDDEDESEDGQAQLYTPFSSRSPHGYEKEQSSQTHKALHDSFGDHELTGVHSDEDGDEEDDDDCEEEEEEEEHLITITTTDKESGKTTRRTYNSHNMPDSKFMGSLLDTVDKSRNQDAGSERDSYVDGSGYENAGIRREIWAT